jgi:hypothetical protein
VRTAFANFRRFARWIRRDARLNPITVTQVAQSFGQQPASITLEELLDAARAISIAREVLIHGRFSPAEIVSGFARAMIAFDERQHLPQEVPRDDVLGPIRNPIWYPEAQGCTYRDLVQLARHLREHVTATHQLPATLGSPLKRIGVNHLYLAMAQCLLARHAGSVLAEIKFEPLAPWPALAPAIGTSFLKADQSGLLDPDLDINTLYQHGKLQTWTLKPAVPSK